MAVDLLINGRDARAEYGVYMGEGFLNALTEPLELKEFISNESRLEHGKRVIVRDPKFQPRELTLDFVLVGESKSDFAAKRDAFFALLYSGFVEIIVPCLSPTTAYRLIYKGKGSDYGMNLARTMCRLVLKFDEPNPNDRSMG